MASDTFLHNLAEDLALEAEEAMRLDGSRIPSDDDINHLGEAFKQALKQRIDARRLYINDTF